MSHADKFSHISEGREDLDKLPECPRICSREFQCFDVHCEISAAIKEGLVPHACLAGRRFSLAVQISCNERDMREVWEATEKGKGREVNWVDAYRSYKRLKVRVGVEIVAEFEDVVPIPEPNMSDQ